MIEEKKLLITFGDFYSRNILGGTLTGLVTERTGMSAIIFNYLEGGIIGGFIDGLVTDKTGMSATIIIYLVGGIIGGIIAGLVTDKTGMSATTCSVMLVIAIPMMFLYESLVTSICPISQVLQDVFWATSYFYVDT